MTGDGASPAHSVSGAQAAPGLRGRPDVLEAYEANGRALLGTLAERGLAEAIIEPDVAIVVSGIPAPPFNAVIGTQFGPDADTRIDAVIALMESRRVPWSWWIGPTSIPADLGDRLVARGFLRERSPGMALDLVSWAPSDLRPGIHVERVRDRVAFHDASAVSGAGFDMPDDIMTAFEASFGEIGYEDPSPLHTWLARIDGRPVATAMGVHDGAVVGVYNVATLPDARGNGAASAVTAAVLAEARAEGRRLAILESSAMAVRLYERLGFETVTWVDLLVAPDEEADGGVAG